MNSQTMDYIEQRMLPFLDGKQLELLHDTLLHCVECCVTEQEEDKYYLVKLFLEHGNALFCLELEFLALLLGNLILRGHPDLFFKCDHLSIKGCMFLFQSVDFLLDFFAA